MSDVDDIHLLQLQFVVHAAHAGFAEGRNTHCSTSSLAFLTCSGAGAVKKGAAAKAGGSKQPAAAAGQKRPQSDQQQPPGKKARTIADTPQPDAAASAQPAPMETEQPTPAAAAGVLECHAYLQYGPVKDASV